VVGEGTLQQGIEMCKEGFESKLRITPPEGIIAKPKNELLDQRGQRIITKIKLKDLLYEIIDRDYTIYCDMDGVLTDFDAQLEKYTGIKNLQLTRIVCPYMHIYFRNYPHLISYPIPEISLNISSWR